MKINWIEKQQRQPCHESCSKDSHTAGQRPALSPFRLLCPWDSQGRNTQVGCHALLQGIFPTWGSNPGLLHCRQILYQLSYQGSPQLTENTASPTHVVSVRWPKGLPSCDYCILVDDTLDLLYYSCILLDIFYFLARPQSLQDLSSLTRH